MKITKKKRGGYIVELSRREYSDVICALICGEIYCCQKANHDEQKRYEAIREEMEKAENVLK